MNKNNYKYNKHLHFEGSCGLYHYQLGITSVIAEKYNHKLDDVYISSVSAGTVSLILLSLYPNINFNTYIDIFSKDIMNNINNSIFNIFNFNYYAKLCCLDFHHKFIKKINVDSKDFLTRTKFNNKVGIIISNKKSDGSIFNPYNYESKLITEWDNDYDFIDCMFASTHIFYYNNFRLTGLYKNRRCLDGCTFNYQHIIENINKNIIEKNQQDNNENNNQINNLTNNQKTKKKFKYLLISPFMWRQFNLFELYFMSSNHKYHCYLYLLGRQDALKNIKELDDFFKD